MELTLHHKLVQAYLHGRERPENPSTAPGGDYAMFAGKDASSALAKMCKDEGDVVGSLHGLSDKEMGVLNDWEKKFEAKYPVVGHVVS